MRREAPFNRAVLLARLNVFAYLSAAFLTACAVLPSGGAKDAAQNVNINEPPLGAALRFRDISSFEAKWKPLSRGIDGIALKIENPPLYAWALRIDLSAGALEIVMNSGEAGTSSLSSIKVSSFMRDYNCAAAINAGQFYPSSNKEHEKRLLTGIFISEGKMISPPDPRYGAFVVRGGGSGGGGGASLNGASLNGASLNGASAMAAIVSQADGVFDGRVNGVMWAAGGFAIIVKDGGAIGPALETAPAAMSASRHPRSAIGIGGAGANAAALAGANAGTIFLLVIDGRRVFSAGATQAETAALLIKLGAKSGLNLDGGGSATLAIDSGGKTFIYPPRGGFRLINSKERAVASCIGFRRR